MKKQIIAIFILIFMLALPGFAQVKSKSRNGKDMIRIAKSTPRSYSCLLRPVRMPINLECEYNLKSQKTGKIAIKIYRYTATGKMEEIKDLEKILEVRQGSGVFTCQTKTLNLPPKDDTLTIYIIASLTGKKGRELAFSSSKNPVTGSYKIFPDKKRKTGDYLKPISIVPKQNSSVYTGSNTRFDMTALYSVASKPYGYIDLVYCNLPDIEKGQYWQTATLAIPRGSGKIRITHDINFPAAFGGKKMGINLLLWLNPLTSSSKLAKFAPFTIKRK